MAVSTDTTQLGHRTCMHVWYREVLEASHDPHMIPRLVYLEVSTHMIPRLVYHMILTGQHSLLHHMIP